MKEKILTLLRIIFGKRPIILKQPVEIVQMSPSNLLEGKCAIVTGGSSGIGYAIAKAILLAGGSVVITGKTEDKLIQSVNKLQLAKKPGHLLDFVVMNQLEPSSFEGAFEQILSKIGDLHIDILVNNAGTRGSCNSDFGKAEESDFDTIMNTNLKGTFFFSQIVARYMKDNAIHGNILNIASSSALRPANSAYILSKWGLRALTLGMAKSLIPHGIVVNAIAPGPTATPMMNRNDSDLNFPQNPSGRLATPEEIANMAVVMTSSMGRMAVGNILYLTGGSGLITLDDAIYDF